jgi:hypothetical protein
MASTRDVLLAALDRWVGRELIDTELERKLRADVEELTARERARWSQYALAATGAVVLLIAAGAFVTWAWPDMGPAARVGVLVVAAVTVQVLGMALQGRERWVPPSYLMQTAGLGILLAAVAYSENAWSDGTPGAVAIGLIGLLFPTGTAVLSIRRGPVMPAVHAAAGFAFLGLFLDRTFPLDGDIVIWILDGVLVLALLVLGHQIRAGLGEEGSDWVLNAFAATLWVGLVLVLLTAAEPLDLEDAAVVPVNAWWLLLVAITLWGIHRAPPALQRSWFDLELGLTGQEMVSSTFRRWALPRWWGPSA